mgnify:CR=1 FL=1
MSRQGVCMGEVRIIGGQWRRTRLPVLARPGLRPTPDRVRETLFNWLGQDLTGKSCLDLFAGSGALGFEAASRGAQHVVMVERDAVAFKALETNVAKLGAGAVELKRADALEFLRADRAAYDVVFLDPPFDADVMDALLDTLPPHLAPRGMVYAESAAPPRLAPPWRVHRSGRAGAVCHQLLTMEQP